MSDVDRFFERKGVPRPPPKMKGTCHCGKHGLEGGSFTLSFEKTGANFLPERIGYHSMRACRTYR